MAGVQNPIIAGDALARGLRTDFVNTYRQRYTARQALLNRVMQLGVPSNRRDELYFYWESNPHPKRQLRGEAISMDGFEGKSYQVENFAWAKGIQWHADDRADDQTGQLFARARALGTNFALIPERVFFQFLTGATDAELLPNVPNAPDGAAMYSATDGGGGNRFGISGGNLVSGGGVASAAAVRTDFFKVLTRMKQFQDTEGQPLYPDELLNSFVIFYGAANEEVFREAFLQTRTVDSSAAVTNIILESGIKVTLVSTQRITDNDWFVFADEVDHRAVFEQNREPIRERISTQENSDQAADTQIESIKWRARKGFGMNLPHNTAKVNN